MRFSIFILLLSLTLQTVNAQSQETNEWRILPSLKYDAFCFIQGMSKDEFYNRFYQRDYTLWRTRLGSATLDIIDAIVDSLSIGSSASYLFAFIPAVTLDDIICALEDSSALKRTIQSALITSENHKYETPLRNLERILWQRDRLLYTFRRMKEEGWENDWKTIAKRLTGDIDRIQPKLTKYSPSFLKAEVSRFLGTDAQHKDSSSTVYYLYYALPIAFKLPYSMMATCSIEEPKQFFNVYLHETLHHFSINAPEFIDLHTNLVRNSPSLSQKRDMLVKQFLQGDDEFYILAAEAYLSVKLGLRTHQEAVDFLKSTNGGTVIYSLLIYEHLNKSFDARRHSFGGFLKDVFFKKVTAKEVDKFISDTK